MRRSWARRAAAGSALLLLALTLLFGARQQARMAELEDAIDASDWTPLYPLHVASFLNGAEHHAAAPKDKLAANPFRRRAWAGHSFALQYNAPRAHYYAQIDQRESRRTTGRGTAGSTLTMARSSRATAARFYFATNRAQATTRVAPRACLSSLRSKAGGGSGWPRGPISRA